MAINKGIVGSVAVIIISAAFLVVQLIRFTDDSALNDWSSDVGGYITAVRDQAQSDKPIALFFYTDWCPNCKRLRESILSSQSFKDFSQQMILVKVNPESSPVNQKLADDFGVIGYPMFYVIPAKGTPVLIRRTSGVTPEEFIAQCKQALVS